MTDSINIIFDRIREHVLNGTTCPKCNTLFEADENSYSIKCPECGVEIELE